MKHIKRILPYSDYWGNCILNMFLSMLLERDKSYEPVIYMNAYEYKITDTGLYVDYSKEYYDFFRDIFVFTRCNFKDRNGFLEELKQLLLDKDYLTLNVDLYYWCKEGAFYNKVHNPHYSFMVGFNEEEDLFYAFEDDIKLDYKMREIPKERLMQAFLSEYKDDREDYRVITLREQNLRPYELNMDKVFSNAEKLVAHLDDHIEQRYILNKAGISADFSFVFRFGNECGKVPNRLRGNVLLLNTLQKRGMISCAVTDKFIQKTEKLSMQWKLIQSKLLKYYFSRQKADLDRIENMIINLFMEERDLWLDLMRARPEKMKNTR